MLKIKDLSVSKELDAKSMSTVIGGGRKMRSPMFDLDFSTHLDNKVASVNQLFALDLSQANAGAVTNNQAIKGGNGPVTAEVDQYLDQDNTMKVYDLGNTYIR